MNQQEFNITVTGGLFLWVKTCLTLQGLESKLLKPTTLEWLVGCVLILIHYCIIKTKIKICNDAINIADIFVNRSAPKTEPWSTPLEIGNESICLYANLSLSSNVHSKQMERNGYIAFWVNVYVWKTGSECLGFSSLKNKKNNKCYINENAKCYLYCHPILPLRYSYFPYRAPGNQSTSGESI